MSARVVRVSLTLDEAAAVITALEEAPPVDPAFGSALDKLYAAAGARPEARRG